MDFLHLFLNDWMRLFQEELSHWQMPLPLHLVDRNEERRVLTDNQELPEIEGNDSICYYACKLFPH